MSIPFTWQKSFKFFENKKVPTEGYSWQNLLLLVALSAQLKRWLMKVREPAVSKSLSLDTCYEKSPSVTIYVQIMHERRPSFVLANCSVWSVSFSADKRSKLPVIPEAKVPFYNYRREFFYQHCLQEIPFKSPPNSYWCMGFGLWSRQGIWCNLTTLTFV